MKEGMFPSTFECEVRAVVDINKKLTEDNFLLYAMHHYDNPQCHNIQEFEKDIRIFLYLKKLITRYKQSDELRERLILNHIIVLYNIFGDAATNMLFYKIDPEDWNVLVTFLVYLERMPESVPQYGLRTSDISLDEKIISALRKI
jgi:hypothetical protein